MIKISNIRGDEKVVTKGAFESIFKPLGYKIVDNSKLKEITGKNLDKATIKDAKIEEPEKNEENKDTENKDVENKVENKRK